MPLVMLLVLFVNKFQSYHFNISNLRSKRKYFYFILIPGQTVTATQTARYHHYYYTTNTPGQHCQGLVQRVPGRGV